MADARPRTRVHLEAIAIGHTRHGTQAFLHKKLLALTCVHDPYGLMRRQALDKRGVDLMHATPNEYGRD